MTNADRIRAMTDEELAEWLEIVDNKLNSLKHIQPGERKKLFL